MSEKVKPSVEELQKKIEDVKSLTKGYSTELEERMQTRPFESAGLIFIAGLILGIMV